MRTKSFLTKLRTKCCSVYVFSLQERMELEIANVGGRKREKEREGKERERERERSEDKKDEDE